MGLQKYRFDETGPVEINGSIPLYSNWMGGRPLAGVRNCPCSDGIARTVYVRGEADTWFSIPAQCSIKGKRVTGYLSIDTVDSLDSGDRLGFRFHITGEK